MRSNKRAIVDLSAVKSNIEAIKKLVGGRAVMPAVKANGYGHGSVEVAASCIAGGADALCVSCVNEGIELRNAGITKDIIILGSMPSEVCEEIAAYNLTPAVCSLEFAEALSKAAAKVKEGEKQKIHLKLDTGMGRIGVRSEDAPDFAEKLRAFGNLDLEGMFTHFPCSDENDRSFTLEQIEKFAKVQSVLKVRLPHAANSGAVLGYPEAYFAGVRPGIIVYGYYPSDECPRTIDLKRALTLKTEIAFLKTVPAGTSVSYGRTYKTNRPSKIATLPIGYADGYPRVLSGRGEAAVRGVRVPIVGRICMDMCMADVTDVPGVSVGDEVTLYGGGYDYLSVDKIAEKAGTISYELLCAIGNRVPRIYINE
ncbi:MAG: alanine racemase [Abditibacteriota bacterium]|nr:alanine racemase [Abditibacteriota bacterium]